LQKTTTAAYHHFGDFAPINLSGWCLLLNFNRSEVSSSFNLLRRHPTLPTASLLNTMTARYVVAESYYLTAMMFVLSVDVRSQTGAGMAASLVSLFIWLDWIRINSWRL
jgi:hypothetical protein